jgi:CRP-like cAMP-binding protein
MNIFEAFFKNYPLLTFNPGERLKRPNDSGQLVRYIKSGHIRIHNYTKSGREVSFLYLSPEEYKSMAFGYSAHLDNYYISAVTPVTSWKAPKKEFVEFLKVTPEASLMLVDGLYDYVGLFAKQNAFLKCGDSRERIAAFLLEMEKNFSEEKKDIPRILKFQLTHQMIADHTGLTRETVSLQLMKLKKEGIIDYIDGFIHVHDVEGLQKRIEDI